MLKGIDTGMNECWKELETKGKIGWDETRSIVMLEEAEGSEY